MTALKRSLKKMEIDLEPDDRIIASTVPPFARRRKIRQRSIRIKEDGGVTYREFQRQGLELDQMVEEHYAISPSATAVLISKVAELMKLSGSMPTIDDSGSRHISLYHGDGVLESVQFPDSGGRKHPNRKPFDRAWEAIEAAAKTSSEQGAAPNP